MALIAAKSADIGIILDPGLLIPYPLSNNIVRIRFQTELNDVLRRKQGEEQGAAAAHEITYCSLRFLLPGVRRKFNSIIVVPPEEIKAIKNPRRRQAFSGWAAERPHQRLSRALPQPQRRFAVARFL